jgi:diaminopimelate decarboxylase
MSEAFKDRLLPLLPSILREFGSAAHIYDELGIRNTIVEMKRRFFTRRKGKNFFAVKACPNISILKIMLDMGFGLDCASPTELMRARTAGAKPEEIMFTSNNTSIETFREALGNGGCILNLDDITFIKKLPYMPKRICFRYNPGELRTGGSNSIIGNPPDQKYGLRNDQIVDAYARARDLGAEIFGIHTMYCSNQCDYRNLVDTAKMQLHVIEGVQAELDIRFEFVNMGGGLGIPYRFDQPTLDIQAMADGIHEAFDEFEERNGYCPDFYTESGRYVTGPHGVIAGKCINRMSKYKEYVGVDFCDAADILRADIYPTSFHGILVLGKENERERELVDVVGPLCENFKLGKDRSLPKITEGDILVIEDTGAHGIAMGSNYNGWGKSQELLFRPDNSVVRIARAQTTKDLLRTELECDMKEAIFVKS